MLLSFYGTDRTVLSLLVNTSFNVGITSIVRLIADCTITDVHRVFERVPFHVSNDSELSKQSSRPASKQTEPN